MTKSIEKLDNQETSTDDRHFSFSGQHTKNVKLAPYKAKKREMKLDFELGDWPEDELNNLLYEMSTEQRTD